MTDGILTSIIYLLLLIIENLLTVIYSIFNLFVHITIFSFQYILNVNMIETSKKRKTNSLGNSNLTVAARGVIDANWQKFLSSNIITDKKVDKPTQSSKKEQFTGIYHRSKKKIYKFNRNVTSEILGHKEPPKVDNKELNNSKNTKKPTKFIAIDCEMVGIGYEAADHMLARVSIVNKFGDCIYDKFVKPREEVKDYRTNISGVRREDMLNGEDFTVVQKEVAELLKGRILVGHSLKNDLGVLFLSHPKRSIRDTSRYKPFREISKGGTPSLKRLAKEVLGIDIQHGEHSSVEDARAAMQLYCTVAKKWEDILSNKRGYNRFDE